MNNDLIISSILCYLNFMAMRATLNSYTLQPISGNKPERAG